MDIESIEVKCVINKSRSLVMSEGDIRNDAGVLYTHYSQPLLLWWVLTLKLSIAVMLSVITHMAQILYIFVYDEAMLTGRGVIGGLVAAGAAVGIAGFVGAAALSPTHRIRS